MRLTWLAALALCSTTAAAHHTSPFARSVQSVADRASREARAAVDAFHAALARGDATAALNLLASDALIFEQSEAERSKAEYAGFHLGADIEFSKVTQERVLNRTARVDGNVAWVATEGQVTGIFRGKPVNRITTETMVLRRAGRHWLITHIHWSGAASGE